MVTEGKPIQNNFRHTQRPTKINEKTFNNENFLFLHDFLYGILKQVTIAKRTVNLINLFLYSISKHVVAYAINNRILLSETLRK